MTIRVKELIWDEFNSSHILKHSVNTEEVEEICSGRLTARQSHFNRFLVIGRTRKKRPLTIILARKSQNIFYPVTARDSSHRERRWLSDD